LTRTTRIAPERTTRIDAVDAMLSIGERFLAQAAELDARTEAAIEADASHADITRLMGLAATDRLRALSAFQAAAPYVSPRLQAIEVSPATPLTRSRFEERLERMSEDEVTAHLKAIAAGTLTIALIDDEVTDD
jgi:hypothetical protein